MPTVQLAAVRNSPSANTNFATLMSTAAAFGRAGPRAPHFGHAFA